MCGRFSAEIDVETLKDCARIFQAPARALSFDARPGTEQFAVARHRGESLAGGMVWGWERDFSDRLLINARIESAPRKKTWAGAADSRRCAIPARGWWEWAGEEGARRPCFHRRGDAAMLFLGALYEKPADTGRFVILTRPSFGRIAAIHDRMPVIVSTDDLDNWLDRDRGFGDVAACAGAAEEMDWEVIECDRLMSV